MAALRQKRPFTQSPYLYGQTIKKQKATRVLHRIAFVRLSPHALQGFRLGAHSVRVCLECDGITQSSVHTRYVMLAKVANKDTQSVVSALIKQARKLPSELYKS